MRFDGQFPDQLVGIANPDFHAPEPGLREVFVVIPAAAAHGGAGLRKSRPRDDDQIYFGRFARLSVHVRFGDPECPRTECPGCDNRRTASRRPRPGERRSAWPNPTGRAPPPSRVRRAGRRKTPRTAPSRKAPIPPPGGRSAGSRRTFFGGEGQVLFFHRCTQLFFSHKTLLFGIKFPPVCIVIPQTIAIFASGTQILNKYKQI